MAEARCERYAVREAGHETVASALRDMMDPMEDGSCAGCPDSLEECLV